MNQEQPAPNGGRAAGSPQGDGDGRAMKDTAGDAQKALDAASAEPRDVPTNGHDGGTSSEPER